MVTIKRDTWNDYSHRTDSMKSCAEYATRPARWDLHFMIWGAVRHKRPVRVLFHEDSYQNKHEFVCVHDYFRFVASINWRLFWLNQTKLQKFEMRMMDSTSLRANKQLQLPLLDQSLRVLHRSQQVWPVSAPPGGSENRARESSVRFLDPHKLQIKLCAPDNDETIWTLVQICAWVCKHRLQHICSCK